MVLASLGQIWGGAGLWCCPAFLSAWAGGQGGLRNGVGVLHPPLLRALQLLPSTTASRSLRTLAGRLDLDQLHFKMQDSSLICWD